MNVCDLYRLLAWNSPAYPIGSFGYSHGLEWAVESGTVRCPDDVFSYVSAVVERAGGWIDAVYFAHVWRAAGIPAQLDELADHAVAFRGSAETAVESRQQGAAFLEVTRKAWPHPLLDAFANRHAKSPVAHSVVVALACAAHGIELEASLHAFIHAFVANLVSAATRLVPLGQTQSAIVIARLAPVTGTITARALQTPIEELGTAAPAIELCSLRHETQYSRLFRS